MGGFGASKGYKGGKGYPGGSAKGKGHPAGKAGYQGFFEPPPFKGNIIPPAGLLCYMCATPGCNGSWYYGVKPPSHCKRCEKPVSWDWPLIHANGDGTYTGPVYTQPGGASKGLTGQAGDTGTQAVP